VEVYKDTRHFHEGPYGYSLVVPNKGSVYLLRGGRESRIARFSRSLLSVAFTEESICVSESDGPIRCLSYMGGTELWRFDPEPGSHAVHLHYDLHGRFFYGVIQHYEQSPIRRLLRFDPATGEEKYISDLNSWEEAFVAGREQLITSDGDMIDLANGYLCGRLDFPRMEYPNPGSWREGV
jgi:hypothetical protein